MIWLAPMMGYTHGWFRSMVQALHPGVSVMTEMLTLQTLKYQTRDHPTLWVHPLEHDTALQIATGSVENVQELITVLQALPMQHINLNAGCPSSSVGQGCMGAMLMHHPELCRGILSALLESGKTVSLKTRLGVDDHTDDMWEQWFEEVVSSGVKDVFLHARIALLKGLSPAQNRSIPPLRYDRAEAIFNKYSHIRWVVNGGIQTVEDIQHWRTKACSGVMLGRIAYNNPMVFWQLACLDGVADKNRVRQWCESIEAEVLCARSIVALLALTKGIAGAKKLRQHIVAHKGKKLPGTSFSDAIMEQCAAT